jgi:selenocysteine lyase/cysteine desulfurase
LTERGWRIATPDPLRSGILSAVPPEADSRAVSKQLEERGIITAPREGAVRFAPHFYNDEDEVKRILEAVEG